VQKRVHPFRSRFATKAGADAQKAQLQRDGCVATTVPIYLTLKAREAANRRRQSSPLGEFCKGWKFKP
jgi:hypothetical protein